MGVGTIPEWAMSDEPMQRNKVKEGVGSKGKGERLPIYKAIFCSFVEQVVVLGRRLSGCFGL